MKKICSDLKAECEALDAIVADLSEEGWDIITPFNEWSVRREISHVAYFDNTAHLAVTDAEGFNTHMEDLLKHWEDFDAYTTGVGEKLSGPELLIHWRKERSALLETLEGLNPKDRIPWYGPSMSAKSFATARLMETWAHGQDVVDALGVDRTASNRLYHIAAIGFITFKWSYTTNQMEAPDVPVRVELTGPSGQNWTWGPEEAENRVSGSAEDFCLVVTRRRHVADSDIKTEGDIARQWMQIGQAFAGPAEPCPPPGTFPKKS